MKQHYLILYCFLVFCSIVNAQIIFEDQSSSLGLDVSCGTTFLGNGVSFCDFDNDGWDDVTLNTENNSQVLFFKNNNGNLSQIDLNIPGLDHQTKQVNWVDFDNDGDKDLFVTSNTEGNKLFENTGNLIFQNITASSGINSNNTLTYGASWGDYDNDSYLDIFISNRSDADANVLYKNNGDGTFTDVTVATGVNTTNFLSFCSAFLDFNNDGFQDIYVANDKPGSPNILYKNNGDGTFTDVGPSSGADVYINAMSVTVDDFNHDGWVDIYVTNTQEGNVFLKNNGDETFTDIASSSGTAFNSVGWGASFIDADNDKDLDLYVSSNIDGSNPNFLPTAFYINNNDETFSLNNSSFPGDDRQSYSNAIGDIDNDGFLDIVATNSNNEEVFLWKNTTVNSNNWLKVKLEGVFSNKDGIGSVIEIAIDGNKQYRYLNCGEGYLSQNSNTEIFGLADAVIIDYVKVTWLSGIQDVIYDVAANQLLTIVENSSPLSTNDFNSLSLNIYPNPVKTHLNINSNLHLDTITLKNILNQEVKKIHSKIGRSTSKIDLSDLKSGLYILEIISNKKRKTFKLIKQ